MEAWIMFLYSFSFRQSVVNKDDLILRLLTIYGGPRPAKNSALHQRTHKHQATRVSVYIVSDCFTGLREAKQDKLSIYPQTNRRLTEDPRDMPVPGRCSYS